MKLVILALCSLMLTCHVHATPTKDRIKDTLSNEEHFAKDGDYAHNPEFDHEAFLGKDDAKTFDELTPYQSKVKLGKLFHKIDTDKDNFVTEEERTYAILHTYKLRLLQRKYKRFFYKGNTKENVAKENTNAFSQRKIRRISQRFWPAGGEEFVYGRCRRQVSFN